MDEEAEEEAEEEAADDCLVGEDDDEAEEEDADDGGGTSHAPGWLVEVAEEPCVDGETSVLIILGLMMVVGVGVGGG